MDPLTIVTRSAETAQVFALVALVVFAGAGIVAGMARLVALAGVAAGLAFLSVAFKFLA
jgi:hypothetical protein